MVIIPSAPFTGDVEAGLFSQPAARGLAERGGLGAQLQLDTMRPDVALHGGGQLTVQRRNDLVG
ncbi:MAG TPA: hypothetical protein VII33_14335, partial [Nakamurella sp.]